VADSPGLDSCDLEDEFNYYFETFINGGEKQLSMITQLQETMKKSLATRPELAATLIPSFGVGCRRLTPGVGYLESLTQDNVDVITQDITSVTANGLVAADGKERKVDTIICATVRRAKH
jgi:cation diffusion facilitator CzcD-associated flavoprotein CzcO